MALSPWLAANPSKRWCEQFFLLYSTFWITGLLGIVVPLQLYEVGVPEALRLCVPVICATLQRAVCAM